MYLLSPFEWRPIPAGRVTLDGSLASYAVDALEIAKYPVTQAQFQAFVAAGDGYAQDRWWDFSPRAKRWRAQTGRQPGESAFAGEDLPCLMVSWFEAIAFCRWLTARTGEAIDLPTEQEWQRAAQGDDSRLYPWGDNFEAGRCNTSESGIKRPTPVSQFPSGASPYGVVDMSGNASEWCLNAHGVPDDLDIRTFPGGAARAVRGGSWGLSQFTARATFRAFNQPGDRFDFQGFRVVRRAAA
jgi:formylglycine-generating enzyme required for sulfatase activity